MNQEGSTVICDPGTGYMKMGFAGDNFPKASFASLVGRPMLRSEQVLGEDVQIKEIMVGDEASKYRSLLELSYPTEEGIVRNWQDMQILLKYSFGRLGLQNLKNRSVFVTEPIMNPVANKAGMMEILFQKFGCDRIQYGYQALMSLYAEGLDTALLVDSGDGVTHCIPVFQGNILKSQFQRLDIAGRHVTKNLAKLLHMRGYAFNSTSDFEIVREIKQKFCFVSGDIKVDNKLSLETTVHEKTFKLPDGNEIKIGRERFMAAEMLMNPATAGIQADGVGEMVFKCIGKCDMALKKELYNNILISGGTSMLPGFPTRLKEEVSQRFQERVLKGGTTSSIKIRVIDTPSRKYNVFIGASIVAKETEGFPEGWKTKRQYEQKGKNRLAQQMTMAF